MRTNEDDKKNWKEQKNKEKLSRYKAIENSFYRTNTTNSMIKHWRSRISMIDDDGEAPVPDELGSSKHKCLILFGKHNSLISRRLT